MVCIVDLHSLTTPKRSMGGRVRELATGLLACGLDPDRVTMFQQSQVPLHGQLSWLLGCLVTMPRLGQLPQYREKVQEFRHVPLGMFVYPVLQAADILLYKAEEVPVGEDQLQHLQLAQFLARKFNVTYGNVFPRIKPLVTDSSAARVKSLRNPSKKMSKSDPDPLGCVYLNDPVSVIREKLKKALTDCTSAVFYDPDSRPAVSSLIDLHSALTGQSVQQVEEQARNVDTGPYKLLIADILAQQLEPVRDRWSQLDAEPDRVRRALERGRVVATERAEETWREVAEHVGLNI